MDSVIGVSMPSAVGESVIVLFSVSASEAIIIITNDTWILLMNLH